MSSPIVDSHVHVWDPGRGEYSWLTSAPDVLQRSYDLAAAIPSFERAGVDAVVLVQADDDLRDTRSMRETAAAHPRVAGIVGFLPLDQPVRTAELAFEYATDRLIVGVRSLIHTYPDADWLLREPVRQSLDIVSESGLCFDLVAVDPRHLMLVPELRRRHPELRIVIDHLAKPPIGLRAGEDPWERLIDLAAHTQGVYAKVSGLYARGPHPETWTTADLRSVVHRCLDLFGAERLMYGGDWPVSLTAGGYDRIWDSLSEVFSELTVSERDLILGGTATEFYGLHVPTTPNDIEGAP